MHFSLPLICVVPALLVATGTTPVFAQPSPAPPLVAELRIDATLSDEMVRFVATQSVRVAVPRTRGRITDLVREACGYTSPNNERVFAAALADQGAILDEGNFTLEAAATQVPACLPDETETRIVGRLPAPGDNFYQYFETDLGVRLTASANQNPRLRVNPGVQLDGNFGFAGHRTTSRFDSDLPISDALSASASAVIAKARSHLAQSGLDPLDGSRVAFESFVATNALIAAGVGPETSRETIQRSLTRLGVPDTSAILDRVEAARTTGQSEPLVRDLPIMADYCRSPDGLAAAELCAAPAAGAPIRLPSRSADVITSLNTRARAANASTIYTSVPVSSVEQVTKTAEIRLASAEGAPEGATVREATAEEVSVPVGSEVSDVSLFLNVQNSTGAGRECRGSVYRNWSTPEFQEAFRAALSRTVAISRNSVLGLNQTQVLVLDGGFFRFGTETFGKAGWSAILPGDADSDAQSMSGMTEDMLEKITHGTVVAGLAMGGPDLMDSFGENAMPVRVATQRAYVPRGPAGSEKYVAHDNLPDLIADEDPDIVNLSIGAKKETTGKLNLLKDTLLSRLGALFVVAAGNKGDNDKDIGQLLADTGLYPQFWGEGQSQVPGTMGYNMLVVAALDSDSVGENLAWFSNYDAKLVYLAAPGCNVRALAPTGEGTYEVRTFNGTSFAAPIVSFVAAAVHAAMPRQNRIAPWVRARLLATADIDPKLDSDERVNHGRILNPVAAVRLYEDVLTLTAPLVTGGPTELAGQLQDATLDGDFDKGAVCATTDNREHSLLRLFRKPAADPASPARWYVDLMTEDDLMVTSSCTLKTGGTLKIRSGGTDIPVPIEKIADIKFAVQRGE